MYSASICVGDMPAATSFLCCFAIKNSLTRVKFCDFSSARRSRVTLSTDSIVRLNVFLLYQRGCQAISGSYMRSKSLFFSRFISSIIALVFPSLSFAQGAASALKQYEGLKGKEREQRLSEGAKRE